MNERHKIMYMEMAELAAKQSYANRLKVGALAVKDHRILSIGYNGTPPGMDNNCEGSDGLTNRNVIHAEMNALYKMARDGQSALDSTLFITHAPCFECSKAILSTGIKNVYYRNSYRDMSGIDLLVSQNVKVEQC